uniref:Uncharacterized protein n=1 Tax=Ditylenchus dipsaci TaxID=166011 RepID=A0A915CYM9_9BILA
MKLSDTCTLAENETNAALVRALDLLNLLGHDSVEGYKAHHTQGPSVVDTSSLNAQDSGTNMDKVCEILDAIDKHNPDLKCLVTHIQTSVIQYAQLLFEQIDKGKADDIQAMLGSVVPAKIATSIRLTSTRRKTIYIYLYGHQGRAPRSGSRQHRLHAPPHTAVIHRPPRSPLDHHIRQRHKLHGRCRSHDSSQGRLARIQHGAKDCSLNQETHWRFIPERAAWMRGFYEVIMVKIVKTFMKKTVKQAIFSQKTLLTLLLEIEEVVNSRSLTAVLHGEFCQILRQVDFIIPSPKIQPLWTSPSPTTARPKTNGGPASYSKTSSKTC